MKISICGLNIPSGKAKYNDPILIELEKKFEPKKFSPYFFEFMDKGFEKCEAIAISAEKLLDLLILDMEKLETRIERSSDEKEILLAKKCLGKLEQEIPLCDQDIPADEIELIRALSPISLKPVFVCVNPDEDINSVMEKVMEKSGHIFFYTAGKDDVRAWILKKGATALTCAEKIHTGLAKGFIRAEVINFRDFKDLHNFNEARQKGLFKSVDRNYPVEYGDIVEIISGTSK